MSNDRGAAPDPRDPESLVRIIDPTPFHMLCMCSLVSLLALSTTVNSLRALSFTAHPNINKKIDATRQHQQDGGDAPIVPVIATVLALGYDAMMCWKCVLYYS
ncbi:hypothetical protein CEP52_015595 [Fusarium oligoseptatum]|uniref:Uncharacterized protein n=1 Tax=Fusarium oligoseptatum TaxID=2604345 RepID=A0A428SBU4_9HYPO|nr:hypothetical protein CEP52_015595 [Fusarium oligoseptatum]